MLYVRRKVVVCGCNGSCIGEYSGGCKGLGLYRCIWGYWLGDSSLLCVWHGGCSLWGECCVLHSVV